MTEDGAPRTRTFGPRAPDGPWDVLVVGAGMGGVSAAALLASVGQRVLVLEHHGVPGGLSQSFRRGPFQWDVGLHVVGEMGVSSVPGRVMRALAGDRLSWTRVPGAYDTFETHDGRRVDFPGSMSGLRESLESAFPAEKQGIRAYLRFVHDASAAMRDRYIARPMGRGRPFTNDDARATAALELALTPTHEVIRRVTDDAQLQAVLEVQWGFYGSDPRRSAFGVHALLCRHFRQGGFYPHGGAQAISRALCATVADHGGFTRVGADVTALLVRQGRVDGVRLETGEELRAPVVIGAGGALNTLALLPAEEQARPWVESIRTLPSSPGHLCLHIGFRGDIRAAGASMSNRWFVDTDDVASELWDPRDRKAPGVYVSFPSLKDGRVDDGVHTAELVVLAPWEPFAAWQAQAWKRRGEDYDALKREISEQLLAVLLRRMPGLAPLVAHTELSTPLSTAHFTRGIRGSIYGLEATPERYRNPWLRARTPIRGLYLAGSDVAVVGIVGAMAGGLAAAVSAMPERASAWLEAAVRR